MYPCIEKQFLKIQKRANKSGWLKRLLVNGRDDDAFLVLSETINLLFLFISLIALLLSLLH
jgi:hypothetical protein